MKRFGRRPIMLSAFIMLIIGSIGATFGIFQVLQLFQMVLIKFSEVFNSFLSDFIYLINQELKF